jgi:hypothetical protein
MNYVKDRSNMFFEEVKEGLFYNVKNRGGLPFFYCNASEISNHLNEDKTIGVKYLDGDVIYNKEVPMPSKTS